MYYRHNREKFLQYVQTPLSQTPKAFSLIFITFLESAEKFRDFEKKDQLHRLNILEVIDSEKCGYSNG